MNISVSGTRTGAGDWDVVRDLPESSLPPLTSEQRVVAGKLGIPQADYARNILAGQRAQDKLLAKTETFARLLQSKVRQRNNSVEIENVLLEAMEGRFYVDLLLEGRQIPLSIDENLVSDLLEGGAVEMEQRLNRIIDIALTGRAA